MILINTIELYTTPPNSASARGGMPNQTLGNPNGHGGTDSRITTAAATRSECVSETCTVETRNASARFAAGPWNRSDGRPSSGALTTSMSCQWMCLASSEPASALYAASFAANRAAKCLAGSARRSQYARSPAVKSRMRPRVGCRPSSRAMREMSARSSPMPQIMCCRVRYGEGHCATTIPWRHESR